jgi:hypothetical protein
MPRRRRVGNVDWEDNSEEIRRAIAKAVKRGLNDIADRIVELAKERVPGQSYNLFRSIQRGTIEETRYGFAFEYGAYAPYAAMVEYGTGMAGEPVGSKYRSPVQGKVIWPKDPPGKRVYGRIYPRYAKVLAWVDPGERRPTTKQGWRDAKKRGVAHFRPWVRGQQAQPFMRPAVDIVRVQESEDILYQALKQYLSPFYRK